MSRILVFGDSIAYGANDITGGGWVQYLRSYFDNERVRDPKKDFSVYNQSVSGNTTFDLIDRVETETKYRTQEDQKDIIVFAIGINDSAIRESPKNKDRTSRDVFRRNLSSLIRKTTHYVDGRIIFIGLTPVDETKTNPISWNSVLYTNERIRQFENAILETAEENKLPFIPIFESLINTNYKPMFPDGLHPDTKGHELIFKTVKDYLEKNKVIEF